MKRKKLSYYFTLLVLLAVIFSFGGFLYADEKSPYGAFTKEQYFKAKRIPPEKQLNPQYGGVFRLSDTRTPLTLDPAMVKDLQKIFMCSQIFNGLINIVPGTIREVYPDLAERWEASDDKLVYTFYLRKGVKFHNGREVTAEDVVYSLNRVKNDKKLFNHYRYINVASIKGIDKYTVRITLKKYDNVFLIQIAGAPGSGVVPREAIEKYGNKFGILPEATIGTGPYTLKEWNSGKNAVVKANPDYFRGRPYIDEVECATIPSDASRQLEFEAGRLELAHLVRPNDKKYLEDPKWKPYVQGAVYPGIYWYSFNFNIKPFDNKKLRQALAYALDRERAIKVAGGGLGEPCYSIPFKTFEGYDPNYKPYTYNPEKAKQLLKEAGYPDGITIPLTIWNYGPTKRFTEFYQGQLAELGINIKIESIEMATFRAEVAKGKFGFYGMARMIKIPDTSIFMSKMFHSRSKGSTGNYGQYENKLVDEYIDLALQERDEKKRISYIRKIQEQIYEDCFWITDHWTLRCEVLQPWVHGGEGIFQNEAGGFMLINLADNNVWVEADKQKK